MFAVIWEALQKSHFDEVIGDIKFYGIINKTLYNQGDYHVLSFKSFALRIHFKLILSKILPFSKNETNENELNGFKKIFVFSVTFHD